MFIFLQYNFKKTEKQLKIVKPTAKEILVKIKNIKINL